MNTTATTTTTTTTEAPRHAVPCLWVFLADHLRPTTSRTVVRLRRVVLSVLLVVLSVVGLNVQGASAWTSPSADAYDGAVTPRGAQAGRMYFKEIGALYGYQVPQITVFGPIAGRSPATSGAQTVAFRYAIYVWSRGRWVTMHNSPAPYGQAIPVGYASTALGPIPNRTLMAGARLRTCP